MEGGNLDHAGEIDDEGMGCMGVTEGCFMWKNNIIISRIFYNMKE